MVGVAGIPPLSGVCQGLSSPPAAGAGYLKVGGRIEQALQNQRHRPLPFLRPSTAGQRAVSLCVLFLAFEGRG